MDRDREKRHEEKNHGPYSLRHALCALLVRRGAAADESSPDRNCDRQSQRAWFAYRRYFGKLCKSSVTLKGRISLFEYRDTEGNTGQRPRNCGRTRDVSRSTFSSQHKRSWSAQPSKRTKTIPIVMAITPDPVAAGLVDSLARPGGNITGLTFLTRELSGKRLELLTEIVPQALTSRNPWIRGGLYGA